MHHDGRCVFPLGGVVFLGPPGPLGPHTCTTFCATRVARVVVRVVQVVQGEFISYRCRYTMVLYMCLRHAMQHDGRCVHVPNAVLDFPWTTWTTWTTCVTSRWL